MLKYETQMLKSESQTLQSEAQNNPQIENLSLKSSNMCPKILNPQI